MKLLRKFCLVAMITAVSVACTEELPATSTVVDSPAVSDWRKPLAENLLYIKLAHGEVVIELAPTFAPQNVENIRTLVSEHYYDDLAILRSQDNYVVQWGDPRAEEAIAKSIGSAAATVTPEFYRTIAGLNFVRIDSHDAYADEVGFIDGFPVGSDGERAWLAHCYGMVGVARGMDPGSGNGSSLYVVTGHAPRHLDRNIALVGRVLRGMEHLSALPRGGGALGFYESDAELVTIISGRLGTARDADNGVEIMNTKSDEFTRYVSARSNRTEGWFVDPGGRIELCNIHPPVRSIR